MGGKAIRKWTAEDKVWLRLRFDVNTSTGVVWIRNSEGNYHAPLFRVGPARKQYLAVSAKIGGKWTKVRLHILVWFFATGEQSLKMIDHIEGDPTDIYHNRFDNLRQATDKQNCANKSAKGYSEYLRADGSVSYFARISWKDSATGKMKSKRSPLQDTPEKALMIYRSWKKQRFGKFAFDGDVQVKCSEMLTVE